MVKKIHFITYFLSVLFFCSCSTIQQEHIKLTGDTNYERQADHSLQTSLHVDYKYKLYESKKKDIGVFLEGKVTSCYDHFGNEMRADGITTLGISF